MPTIKLITNIKAPAEIVFNLARSIDLHTISIAQTKEEAVAGKTSGLIDIGESVTWRARHFGITQYLTSKITEFDYPNSFTDEMVKGAFRNFKHTHIFTMQDGVTVMTDIFEYKSPFGLFGKAADFLFLNNYMQKLLIDRNTIVKKYAEEPALYKKVLPL